MIQRPSHFWRNDSGGIATNINIRKIHPIFVQYDLNSRTSKRNAILILFLFKHIWFTSWTLWRKSHFSLSKPFDLRTNFQKRNFTVSHIQTLILTIDETILLSYWGNQEIRLHDHENHFFPKRQYSFYENWLSFYVQ